MQLLTPDLAAFCLISFEGPDCYAQAGGLGVRITHLAETVAGKGFDTHLLFVGDPDASGQEERCDGRLNLLHDQLDAAGLRQHCVLFWNANNTMSFNRVNWPRLSQISHITTVSRYMKHLMWDMSLNPLVIPNGIPATLLEPVDPERVTALRHVLDPDQKAIFLFKVGRFDLAKRWLAAKEAAGQDKAEDHPVLFSREQIFGVRAVEARQAAKQPVAAGKSPHLKAASRSNGNNAGKKSKNIIHEERNHIHAPRAATIAGG
jgi:hypothetical protein